MNIKLLTLTGFIFFAHYLKGMEKNISIEQKILTLEQLKSELEEELDIKEVSNDTLTNAADYLIDACVNRMRELVLANKNESYNFQFYVPQDKQEKNVSTAIEYINKSGLFMLYPDPGSGAFASSEEDFTTKEKRQNLAAFLNAIVEREKEKKNDVMFMLFWDHGVEKTEIYPHKFFTEKYGIRECVFKNSGKGLSIHYFLSNDRRKKDFMQDLIEQDDAQSINNLVEKLFDDNAEDETEQQFKMMFDGVDIRKPDQVWVMIGKKTEK